MRTQLADGRSSACGRRCGPQDGTDRRGQLCQPIMHEPMHREPVNHEPITQAPMNQERMNMTNRSTSDPTKAGS